MKETEILFSDGVTDGDRFYQDVEAVAKALSTVMDDEWEVEVYFDEYQMGDDGVLYDYDAEYHNLPRSEITRLWFGRVYTTAPVSMSQRPYFNLQQICWDYDIERPSFGSKPHG